MSMILAGQGRCDTLPARFLELNRTEPYGPLCSFDHLFVWLAALDERPSPTLPAKNVKATGTATHICIEGRAGQCHLAAFGQLGQC